VNALSAIGSRIWARRPAHYPAPPRRVLTRSHAHSYHSRPRPAIARGFGHSVRSQRQDARLEKFSWHSVESGGSRSSKR
jgi:hypothetical protein